MAWLDDRAWCHPKLVNLSDKAFRAHVNGMCYCAGMGTKGVLTRPQQELVGGTARVRRELEAAGLWEPVGGGSIYVHDWDDHNQKRDERRERDRERKRLKRQQERESADCPADSPSDVPGEVPQLRRALTEVKEVKEVTTTTKGFFETAGWNDNQRKEALTDEPRARAWVKHSQSLPNVLNVAAFAWTGFKTGVWPPKTVPNSRTPQEPPSCEECGMLIRDGHTATCSVGLETERVLAELA